MLVSIHQQLFHFTRSESSLRWTLTVILDTVSGTAKLEAWESKPNVCNVVWSFFNYILFLFSPDEFKVRSVLCVPACAERKAWEWGRQPSPGKGTQLSEPSLSLLQLAYWSISRRKDLPHLHTVTSCHMISSSIHTLTLCVEWSLVMAYVCPLHHWRAHQKHSQC